MKTRTESLTSIAFIMCALGAIFYCYEYYLRVAPSVMSEELKLAFGLTEGAFGQLAAFYYFAYTPMQIPVGMMMDRFGVRKILTFACVMCVLGTYLFTVTNSLALAQLGRFLMGFGSAFAYVGVLKISDVWLPKKYFALMAGLTTTLGMFGAISGEIVMAHSVTQIGWRETLMYAAVIGGLLSFALWFMLRDDTTTERFKSKELLKGFLEILFNRQLWINGVIGCITFLPISAFAEIWAVPYLEAVGFPKEIAAVGSSLIFLGFAIGGPFFGFLSDLIKSRKMPMMVSSLGAAFCLFLIFKYPSTSQTWMFGLLFLAAFLSSAQVLIFAIANDLTRTEVTATAVAFTNMVVMIGGALLPPWIGKVVDELMHSGNAVIVTQAEGFSKALMILPCSLVLASFLCILLKETHNRQI